MGKWNQQRNDDRDNGRNRNDNRTGPRADPRALQARRGDVHVDMWAQVTGKGSLQDACIDMLNGTPKRYPIFGLRLEIEMRDGKDGPYPALVFHGASTGHVLEGAIRPPFVMTPAMLGWTIGPNVRFKTEMHETLVLYLLDQPEMVWARDYVNAQKRSQAQAAAKAERDAADAAKQKRQSVLETLRAKQGMTPAVKPASDERETDDESAPPSRPKKQRGPKIDRPELEELKDILTVSDGVIEHDSCTIMVCRGGRDGDTGGWHTVVRITRAPEDHPMYGAYRRSMAVHQHSLQYLDQDEVDTDDEKAILRRQLQDWLRSELVAAGVNITSRPTDSSAVKSNGNGSHADLHPTGDPEGNGNAAEAS